MRRGARGQQGRGVKSCIAHTMARKTEAGLGGLDAIIFGLPCKTRGHMLDAMGVDHSRENARVL